MWGVDRRLGKQAGRLEGWRQWPLGKCIGFFSVFLCGFGVGFWSNQKRKQQHCTKLDYEVG